MDRTIKSAARLKEALRYLLLPVSLSVESEWLARVAEILRAENIDDDDHFDFIELKYEEWRSGGVIDSTLEQIIKAIILISDPVGGERLANAYVKIHSELRLSNRRITFEVATILLGQGRLISNLAVHEKMSAAKICSIIKSIDSRLSEIRWQDIYAVLEKLNVAPQLTKEMLQDLYSEDEESEKKYFGDATLDDAAKIVGEVGKRLRFGDDLEYHLRVLSHSEFKHVPYLQILHLQCSISGYFDHVVTCLYEFSPRGNAANLLFSKWEHIVSTSNPILNNAKAVDLLDSNWANTRKTNEFLPAHSLVQVLSRINGMGFPAAQELTSWIRRFLIRFIKSEAPITQISIQYNIELIRAFLHKSRLKESNTFGILEQRLIDSITRFRIMGNDDWRPRGLGDSINCNNLSKKKLGDVDYQSVENKQILAFEVHAGTLTDIYLRNHLRSLWRVLELRIEELETFSDASEWNVIIQFISFNIKVSSSFQLSYNYKGVSVEIELTKMDHFIKNTSIDERYKKVFIDHFISPLNERNTPQFVRDYVQETFKFLAM